uniref:Uncharacterized protein n=1 Tax=Aegilops tauschii subsp. strangulata TaxID=200361 RepID=A0A453P1Q4_AEGTS
MTLQMTLWSMAKSPLIYGGDLRHLDNSTFSIMTNPTLLKINYYSKNNMEFHYVSGETTSNTRHSGHLSPRYPVNPTKHDGMVVGLTSCTNDQANGWFVFPQDGKSDHICRIYETENGKNVSFCLGKTKPLLASDDDIMEKEEDQTKFHLAVADINDSCLDASASRRRTASEVKLLMFSRCKWHARQMWELNDKGNLVSSYSRLCATVESSKEAGNHDIILFV